MPASRPPLRDLCFYHSRFGSDAIHCISPCAWKGPLARPPGNTNATLPKKRVAHPGFVVGGLQAINRKALKTGMLIVRDPKTHIEFMVDSGSRRSVIPCHGPATHPSVTAFMSCINGSEVLTFESVELELALNLGRSFTWTFVKADVLFATLRLDFQGLSSDVRPQKF